MAREIDARFVPPPVRAAWSGLVLSVSILELAVIVEGRSARRGPLSDAVSRWRSVYRRELRSAGYAVRNRSIPHLLVDGMTLTDQVARTIDRL